MIFVSDKSMLMSSAWKFYSFALLSAFLAWITISRKIPSVDYLFQQEKAVSNTAFPLSRIDLNNPSPFFRPLPFLLKSLCWTYYYLIIS